MGIYLLTGYNRKMWAKTVRLFFSFQILQNSKDAPGSSVLINYKYRTVDTAVC